MDTIDIVLEELRSLRTDYNDHARDTGERLSALESQIKSGITGNGQPSRLQVAETAIEKLSAWRWYLLGAAAGVSGVVSAVAWIVVEIHKS